jgi:phospholipid/cholesterol/gamma-HCH transport system substrate-binding protein
MGWLMESKVNFTVVGIFVIVLSILLVVFFFWLTTRHAKAYNIYLTYMQEEVTGLSVQSPVRFNGVLVGYVDKIEIDPRNPQLVKLTLKIKEGTPINTSTVAMLNTTGITGIMYVGLKAKTVNAPPLKVQPGQQYPVIPSQPSLLVQLGQVLPQITKNIEQIGNSITKVLDEENRAAIRRTLQHIDRFTKTLSDNNAQIDRMIKSFDTTLQNAAIASKDFPQVMKQLNTSLAAVQATTGQIDRVSLTANKTLGSARLLIQNFSEQVMPTTQQLLEQLNNSLGNLQQFTQELNRNPAMLIRGKQPAVLGPGER